MFPPHGIMSEQPCYVCQSPTKVACARCKRPICSDHTKFHRQMHWETWRAGGSRFSTRWKRYMPSGAELKVSSACDATLRAAEAPQRLRDRVLVRKTVIRGLIPPVAAIAVFLVPFLLGHFVCR